MEYNKVIQICNYAANYAGNFLASLDSLAQRLKVMGKEVVFVFPNAAQNKKWEIDLSGFKMVYTDFDNDVELLNSIKKEIPNNGEVIIHTHFMNSMFLLKLKTILSSEDKVVFHEHMAVNYGIRQKIKGEIVKLFGFRNTVFIGVSPDVYNDLQKEVGKVRARLVVNSLDLDRLKVNNSNKKSKNILIFGSDYKRKGVDLAINAIEKAHLESKVNLVVVTHSPKEAKKLIINEFNIIPSFVKIRRPSNDVRELYAECFLFLSPSRLEAFGYSVIEAKYTGMRVIASNVPGQNTLKNVPGISWVDSENIDQLSNAILKEYNSAEDNEMSIVKKSRRVIENKYSLERWVNQVINIYNEK